MNLKIVRPVNRLLKPVFIAAFLMIFHPEESAAQFSAGFAKDIIHSPKTTGLILRYDRSRVGLQAMYWDGPDKENGSISVDYDLLPGNTWDLNLGAAYIAKIHDINGTHLNFSAGLGVNMGKHLRIQFTHMSNAHNGHNDGWNFVAILARF